MKKINRTFLVILVIGVIVFVMGLWGYQDSLKEVTGSWKYSQKELEEQQEDNKTISIVMIVGGIGLVIGAFIYNSHFKTNTRMFKEIMNQKGSTKEQLNKLKSLYEEKAITKEEYETKRKDIIDKM